MAYYLTHTINFNNAITENIFIELYRKDIIPDSVTQLKATSCIKRFINGQGDRFDTIISSELNFEIYLNSSSQFDRDDFLVSLHDEWKVILKNDGQIDFIGFLVPNECQSEHRDLPYTISLTATDGLGYLKNINLLKYDGTNFADGSELNNLYVYVISALKKTNLDLNLRLYCNIYDSSMNDRHADNTSDAFNKTKLDYRTFLKDATTFTDCWNAIEILLTEGFTLFQWFGKWVIFRIGEMQGSIGPKMWYTEYLYDGTIVDGVQEIHDNAIIAKQQVLHPINADQSILSRFAIKSALTQYKYEPWPEIPRNNKFERGARLFGVGNPDQKAFYIDNWTYGVTKPSSPSTFPPTGMLPTTDIAHRLSTYNVYGVEVLREVVLDRLGDNTNNGYRFLMCDPIPVITGHKVKISFDYRTSAHDTGTQNYLMVMLQPDAGGLPYRIENDNPVNGVGNLRWVNTSALRFLSKFYDNGETTFDYTNFTIDMPGFPVNGKLYICLMMNDPPLGRIVYYKNFSVEYTPIVGGNSQVKGDQWFTEQTTNYKDVVNEQVYISDSPAKVFKGSLLQNDGVTLTTRTWHRLDINEQKEFKELVNIGRYNGAYRRTWQISGTFGGTMFHPVNNQTIRMPLGFHKHFSFPNDIKLNGYYFQLVPPLSIDYKNGEIQATFVDCYKDGSNDGDDIGNLHEFKYQF